MNNTGLPYLYNRYIHQTATEQETVDFLKAISMPENEALIKQLIEQSFRASDAAFKMDDDIALEIIKVITATDAKKKRATIIRMYSGKYWRSISAIACLFIVAVAGIYIWSKGNSSNTVESIVNNDKLGKIAPGKTGGILTLADGNQIVLDVASKGVIAKQGNVAISKTAGTVMYKGRGAMVYNTMSTSKGQQYTVILADNSKVLLNAESSIRFPTSFNEKERVVEITGEAYFEVAKDPLKKFIVKAGNTSTEVLGTHFIINSYSNEEHIAASLLEGKIKFSIGNNAVYLIPGNQARTTSTGSIDIVKDINIDEVSGWVNGYFYFEKADIETVMRQMARWYDIEVVYKGPVSKEFFAGKIQRDLNLSQVMEVLKTIGIVYKLQGNKLIIGN